jgi:methylglutaconyl-CoA hydratase
MDEGYVKSITHQGVTTIEFFHPKGNSLPAKILADLTKKIHLAGNHAETKVIVLKSAGDKSFCAGASFDELVAIKNEADGLKFFTGFANLINAMRKCPKFIIARIQGKCVGGGIGVAAAADYCIALNTVEIKLSELALGIGPLVIGPAVERKIGLGAFSALAIDATIWRNAEWGKRKNIFAEVHETVENMDEAIYRLTNHLAQSNPDAMAEIKKMLWQGTEHWDELLKERAAVSGRLALSEFAKNAIVKLRENIIKEQ